MRRLRGFTDSLKTEFFLLGEAVHGDYNRIANDGMLHSATNYECYKGLYSSLNSMNMFEIVHSLLRQFGPENWTLYRGKHHLCFVDNHDVSRIASTLNNERHLPLAYGLMFGMPGIPCVYYGSEWGFKAHKSQGDPALRPCFENYEENELTELIGKLSEAKKNSKALNYGDFQSVVLNNKQCIFARRCDEDKVLVCINAEENEYTAYFNVESNNVVDLLTGEKYELNGKFVMKPYSINYLKLEV